MKMEIHFSTIPALTKGTHPSNYYSCSKTMYIRIYKQDVTPQLDYSQDLLLARYSGI